MKTTQKLLLVLCLFLTSCTNLFADQGISDDRDPISTVQPTTIRKSNTATATQPRSTITPLATHPVIDSKAVTPTIQPWVSLYDFDFSNDFRWLYSVVTSDIYKTNMDEKTTEKWVDPGFKVTTIELSQDDVYMGVGGRAGELCIYETASAELLGCYDDHDTAMFFIEFSSDGDFVATNSQNEIILWTFNNGNLYPTGVNIQNYIAQDIHFDDRSTALYYSAYEGGINKVDLSDYSIVKIFPEDFRPFPVWDFEIIDDDLFFAFENMSDKQIFGMWNMEGEILRKTEDPMMTVFTIEKIPDDNCLLIYDKHGNKYGKKGIYCFNPETGTLNLVLALHNPSVWNHFEFSDQSLNKVAFIDDEGINVLDMTTWTISCRIQFSLDSPYTEFW